MRFPILAASLLAATAIPANAQDMIAPDYPETRRGDVVELSLIHISEPTRPY